MRTPKDKKLSLAAIQAQIRSQAPHGWTNATSKAPLAFMDKTPRAARAPGVKNKHPEDDLQIVCCQFLDLNPRIIYWATPNSIWVGEMTPQKMGYLNKLKRIGVKKGIPDISMFFRNKHGAPTFCWAELKAGSNKATEEQEFYMERLNERGGFTSVVRSLEDLKDLLKIAEY